MESLTAYVRFMDKINNFLKRTVAFIIFAVFALLFIQVIMRFVIHSSLSWSEELARYLTIWMVFLGVSVAVRYQSLIAVEIVTQTVPKKIKTLLQIIVLIMTMAFSLFIVIYGAQICKLSFHDLSTAIGLPMWIPYAAIPIGGVLMFFNTIVALIEVFAGGEGD